MAGILIGRLAALPHAAAAGVVFSRQNFWRAQIIRIMPENESFGGSEREMKRRLAEIEKQVQIENKPLGEIGVAIVQAATNCRDAAKASIQAPTEKVRIEREIYIFYEFIYFFMHMTLRQAFGVLSATQMGKLQGYLGPLISSTAIDSYFAHWPDDIKQKMTNEFYEKLNESEMEYSESTKLDNPFLEGEERSAARLKKLFMKVASNIASLAVDDDENAPDVILLVIKTALDEWDKMRLDTLVANVAKSG